jgi:hypothetical protein
VIFPYLLLRAGPTNVTRRLGAPAIFTYSKTKLLTRAQLGLAVTTTSKKGGFGIRNPLDKNDKNFAYYY